MSAKLVINIFKKCEINCEINRINILSIKKINKESTTFFQSVDVNNQSINPQTLLPT